MGRAKIRVIFGVGVLLLVLSAQSGRCQSLPWPLGSGGFSSAGSVSPGFREVLYGLGFTSAKAGIYWGFGDIFVDEQIAQGGEQVDLLWKDFSTFHNYRRSSLKDNYVSAVIGLGYPGREYLTLGYETNFARMSQFRQYTEAGSVGQPVPEYRGALGTLTLPDGQAGLILLDSKNYFQAFDIMAKLPAFRWIDLLAGYKFMRVTSSIDPFSENTPANAWPVFPGQAGWTPAWADNVLTSVTQSGMAQKLTWHGPFLGASMRINGFGWVSALDARVYPYLFGKYEFFWNGVYLDPDSNFTPGIWGSQTTSISGRQRSAVELEFRSRYALGNRWAIQLQGRYMFASMAGSKPASQTLGNVYGPFNPSYWGAANYTQFTPETVSVKQQLSLLGGSMEFTF